MKKLFHIFTLILLTTPLWAATEPNGDKKDKGEGDKREVVEAPAVKSSYKAKSVRTFDNLSIKEDQDIIKPDPLNAEQFETPLSDTVSHYVERALQLDEYLKKNNRFVETLDQKTLIDLPVGIKKEIGGLTYSISIDSIVMTPTSAYLIAYMVFEVPSSGKKLTFRGTNITLSKSGGIGANARLELIGDQSMNLFGQKSVLSLKGDGSTFVEFDCNGFKMMGVGAEVTFSRDLFVPENEDGTRKEGRVKAAFNTTLSNWNDLIAEVKIPDFQVKDLKGVGFSIKDAIFDFSDYRNAPAITFPEGYQSTSMLPGSPGLWRGFYIRELSISLPSQFNAKGESERKKFAAHDVLIDNMGFTGTLEATKLLQLDEGDMNGWAFSLDSLHISLEANHLTSAGFNGNIVVPISGEETPFEYSAIINPGDDYIFNISPAENIQFEVFKTSKVEIYESSYIEVGLVDGKFRPKANLNGKMDIQAKLGKSESSKSANLADISFESLEIQSVKPYVKAGNFSFGSEKAQQMMSGFPVSIDNIGFKSTNDTEVSLDFDLKVNLNKSFGGQAGLSIVGQMDKEEGFQSWKYKNLQVNDILVDIDQGAYKFYGKLTFYRNDQTYGDGFNGIVDAEFKPGIKVKATAIFGTVTGMRYWYTDALAEFGNGIPIFTGVAVYGFGGGAYYHMKMDTEGVGSELGKTNSGIVYVPDDDSGLGLKASITIGSNPSKKAFNGDATFEISFFKGGGVRYIAFSGNAYVMTPALDDKLGALKDKVGKVASVASKLNSRDVGMLSNVVGGGQDNSVKQIYGEIGTAAGKRGQLSAHMLISYDFENRVLHGNMEMYVNVAGGIIKGIGAGGRAGWAVIHFAPDDWYIYVGTPDDRIGVSAGIGPIRAELNSYFMVGTKILGSPPPPPEVSDILGVDDLDYMSDLNALGTGAGFAFGSAFSVDTGDLTFLMFYARFKAGAGFDIMLKDYGSAQCKGREGPIGINGWYANGQAYAYFEGKVGIRVKVFGRKKKVDILEIGAAAILQAKLPNPFWMRGIVGGRFSVLGGLVKGDCKFEVTLGEECEIVGGSVLEGLNVISDVTPQNQEKDVNVFTTPQAVFNMPVEHVFEMIDTDEQRKSFRIKLDDFKLIADEKEIPGVIEWNETSDVAAFNSHDVFPSKKQIKAIVQVSFEEYDHGHWTPVVVDGSKYVERKEITFTSGVAPDYIPKENVAYSYPVIDQLNFYKDEYNKGYIKLKKGQPYLFEVSDDWVQKGRFTSVSDKSEKYFQYSYSPTDTEVNFSLPTTMNTNTIYQFELVNIPKKKAEAIDKNVKAVTYKVDIGNTSADTEITTKEAEGTIENLQEKQIFEAFFRSSLYSTFDKKIMAMNLKKAIPVQIYTGIDELRSLVNLDETFDQFEIGSNYSERLISFEATLNNNWYENSVEPLVYSDYPINGKFSFVRDEEPLGVPPVHAMFLRQNNELIKLNKDKTNLKYDWPQTMVIYNLPIKMNDDYMDLNQQLADYIITGGSPRIEYVLNHPFPFIPFGYYKFYIQYKLPGKAKITSRHLVKLDFNY